MHGKDATPADKWYPWFAEQVRGKGYEFAAPALPNASDPDMQAWQEALNDLVPDVDTILVGHSRGGVAILRWLENQPDDLKVHKVILVATNSGFDTQMARRDETNRGFYTSAGYNFEAIKKHCSNFVVLHSKDDHWVPYDHGLENSEGLDAKLISFDDRGHFGKEINEIPELIDEVFAN